MELISILSNKSPSPFTVCTLLFEELLKNWTANNILSFFLRVPMATHLKYFRYFLKALGKTEAEWDGIRSANITSH